MKFNVKLNNILSILLVLSGSLTMVNVSAAPLSCQMQSMLVFAAAVARDQGKSQAQVKTALKKDGELTNSEVKAVLDIVFVHLKNSQPAAISQIVQTMCK